MAKTAKRPPSIYVMDPQTQMLVDTGTGAALPLSHFHSTRPTIALDPGHGVHKADWDDSGIIATKNGKMDGVPMQLHGKPVLIDGRPITEADITSSMALAVGHAMTARGYDVIITRPSVQNEGYIDAGYGFKFRRAAARKADIFVSLHVNTAAQHDDTAAHGTRLYSDSRNTPGSSSNRLRAEIAEEHPHDIIHDDLVRQDTYKMLDPRNMPTPAVLLEVGFISNPQDFANMMDPNWRARFGNELANDIERFRHGIPKEPHAPHKGATPGRPYTVKAHDGWYAIAKNEHVAYSQLRALNKDHKGVLKIGDTLNLPPLCGPESQCHVVAAGESWYGIATHYGISIDELKKLNAGHPDVIKAGEILEVTGADDSRHKVHVMHGDTLSVIARRLEDSTHSPLTVGQIVKALEKANHLPNGDIKVGDTLTVPDAITPLPTPKLKPVLQKH